MISDNVIKTHINNCKSFWMVEDFEKEILNWEFSAKHPENKIFNIGHPRGAHKGASIGDILPYTRLPEVIKSKYEDAIVTVPEWFSPIFKNNPHVDSFTGGISRYGSLGTWGTTIQRTCNVWGFKTFKFTPKVYCDNNPRKSNALLFCVNSKTGGRIKNLKQFELIIEHLKQKYYCVQLGLKTDDIVRSANEYIFNASVNNLVNLVSQFTTYIGSQNSIYHLSKALGLTVIGILPENVPPELVMLPMLTQMNYRETEMLTNEEKSRPLKWKKWMIDQGKNPDDSHHIGWLYPDSIHLTERSDGNERCPTLSGRSIDMALNKKIYPYDDERLWKIDKYRSLWI